MATKTSSNWKARAQKELKAGYIAGSWQGMLDRALRENRPELVKELGQDYQNYLIVMVAQARDHQQTLLQQGTNPHAARELAIQDLMSHAAST